MSCGRGSDERAAASSTSTRTLSCRRSLSGSTRRSRSSAGAATLADGSRRTRRRRTACSASAPNASSRMARRRAASSSTEATRRSGPRTSTAAAVPRGEAFTGPCRSLRGAPASTPRRSSARAARPPHRPPPRLLHALPLGAAAEAGAQRATIFEQRGLPRGSDRALRLGVVPQPPSHATAFATAGYTRARDRTTRASSPTRAGRAASAAPGATSAAGSARSGRAPSTTLDDGHALPLPTRREPDEPAAVRPVVGPEGAAATARARPRRRPARRPSPPRPRAHEHRQPSVQRASSPRALRRLAQARYREVTLAFDNDSGARRRRPRRTRRKSAASPGLGD